MRKLWIGFASPPGTGVGFVDGVVGIVNAAARGVMAVLLAV